MFEEKSGRRWGYLALAIGGSWALILGSTLALARATPTGLAGTTRITLMMIAGAAAIIWAFFFGILAFRNKDEFGQQESRVAWYWGGSLGLAASTLVFEFLNLNGLHWLVGSPVATSQAVYSGKDLHRIFIIGYMLPVLMQVAGFFIARIWWRISKNRPE